MIAAVVDDQQDFIGRRRCFPGPVDADAFDYVVGGAQPGGVHELDGQLKHHPDGFRRGAPEVATLPLLMQRLMAGYRMEAAAGTGLVLVTLTYALFWVFDRGGRLDAAA